MLAAACSAALAGSVQSQVVKNSYYSLDLGTEWEQPKGDKMQNNNYSTLYTNKAHDTAIYLSINDVNMTAEQIATKTAESMKATGAKIQPIQKDGEICYFDYILQEVPGRYVFRTNTRGYTAVSIIGKDIEGAVALLKTIKPYGPSVVPEFEDQEQAPQSQVQK